MIPPESAINRLMDETGMDRLPAIRHLQSREALARGARPVPPAPQDCSCLPCQEGLTHIMPCRVAGRDVTDR